MPSPDLTPDRPARAPSAEWIVDAVPDGLWMFDDEGRTTYANDKMAALLGLPPDDVLGFTVFDALDEQGRSDFARHLDERDRTKEPGHDIEVCLLGRDGSQRWTLVSHAPVRDEDGRFRGWLYRVRDHTKQRELIDDLRRRDRQFAEAQTTARIGTWERDVRSGRVDWSDEAYRLCGVDPDTFRHTSEEFYALLNPEDSAVLSPLYQRMIEHDEPLDVECRLADESTRRTWLRIRGVVVRDEAGAPVRVGGTLQDITTSKNHRLGLEFVVALAGAANQARSLAEVLAVAELHVQPYAQWPAVLVAAPMPPDDLIFLDAQWSAHTGEVREFARELAREAVASGLTVQRPGPDGVVLVAGPVLVGDRLGCVIVADTQGTYTAVDSDLAFFTQMLAILAQVAEREWAAEDLAAARDQALSASRAKSEFLATMSHEIRTPLNGVIGLSELLRRTELTTHQQRLADGVDQAGRTLLALVNDVLDLSKIEAGRLDLEEVDFDPRAVLEQSAGLLADRASAKGLELVISSAADVPSLVRGDPVRFGQVITNLTSNAVKFTAEGEVVIRARRETDRADHRGPRVRVEVRDTGVGIDEGAQARLFEAFTQADSSTTREYGGTGLGLAISKRIVSAMAGDIGVTSAPGSGSTFWFDVAFDLPHGQQAQTDSTLEDAISGMRVLVVDDNATNRFILIEQLSRWGVVITAVESSYEALVELDASVQRSSPYDVVLLDYMMPGADGEQLARIIRAERRHDQTRLALLSSIMDPTPEWLADTGIDSFLSKPVLPSRLLDVLATLGGRLPLPGPSRPRTVPGAGVAQGGRILVVEDNAINQLVAEGMLRRLGYEVVLADNGAAGVAAVADEPETFVAILMDCQMPVMDGFDATRAVRAIQSSGGRRTPIIAMTASALAEERDRCLDAGMDDFLTKPVNVGLLGAMLERWIAPPSTVVVPAVEVESAVAARLGDLLANGIDAAFVLRIVTAFQDKSGAALDGLQAAVDAGAADEVVQHAHSLRGSAGNVGLSEVADLATQIELGARTEILPASLIGDLRDAVDRGAAELDAFVRDHLSREG